MQRKELGIAVIGSGRIGSLRARLAAQHPAVKFLAISDLDPARARALGELTGADYHSGDNYDVIERPEMGVGNEADADYMQSTVGLVWRALVVCLLMLTLLGVAGWVGR